MTGRNRLDEIETADGLAANRAYKVGYEAGFAAARDEAKEEMARSVRTRESAIDYWKTRATAAEATVTALQEKLKSAKEAWEPFAKEAAELADGVTDDCVYALPRFPDLGLSYFDVGDLRRARTALTTIRRTEK